MSAWGRRVAARLLDVWALVVLLYLFVPIAVIVLFSFNRPVGARNYEWNEFSLDAWTDPFKDPKLRDAFVTSLEVAAVATAISCVLGTLVAVAAVKYRFRGRGALNALLVLPLTMPEIVLGFSLLLWFSTLGVSCGVVTIVIAHVMFCVSYVATTVKARVRGFDWSLEDAAMDLGAGPVVTFRRVTLPLIAPGILAAALLTFALSLDDFIITYLNSGLTETFPVYVWNTKRSRVPPQLNVFGTMVLVVSIVLAGLIALSGRRRAAGR